MEFIVEGVDKSDALEKAKSHVENDAKFDNCKKDTIKIAKKLKSK